MKDLVYHIVSALVDHPEEITINELEKGQTTVIQISTNPDDLGKIIGRQGRIAKAIRTVVKAASMNSEKKVVVEIL